MSGPPLVATQRRLPLAALMGANAISFLGSQFTALAVPWFVLETTASAGRAGLAAVASLSPIVIASAIGSPAIDRLGYKRASVVADLAAGGTIALVPLLATLGRLGFGSLLLIVFVSALFDAPGGTARASLVPEVSAAAGMPLERANGVQQIIGAFAQLAGPPAAGLLIAGLGARAVLWIDAASFLLSAGVVALLVPATRRTAHAAARYLRDIADGWRALRADPLIRDVVLAGAAVNLLLAPAAAVVLPAYALETYGDAGRLGLLLGAFGAGAVAGAVAFTIAGHGWPRRRVMLAGFALGGTPLLALALTPSLAVNLPILVVAGIAAGPIQPLVATIQQERIPQALRARILGAATALALIAAPAGTFVGGIAAQAFGVRPVLVAMTGCFIALAVAVALLPSLRTLDAPP